MPETPSQPAEFSPHVDPNRSISEASAKAMFFGIIFGILFGAANAYLGLQAGLTISTSIPVAVMTVAVFRLLRRAGFAGSILEANLSQTVGSASSSVASGIIFTLPALFMWGLPPTLVRMSLLGICGGLLGVLFMIPLRRFLIAKEHGTLPYPEGTACAEVLIASEVGGSKASNVFIGLGLGALFKFMYGWLKILPDKVHTLLPVLPKADIGMKLSPALFGVGYILGPRIGAIMVGGGLLSSLIIIPILAYWGADLTEPFYPETDKLISAMSAGELWNRYVRYIGAGAVATAGILTLIRSIPTMIESFRIGAAQLKDRLGESNRVPRTAQDLSLKTVGLGILVVVSIMTLVPMIFGIESFLVRLVSSICVTVCAFFFVTVSSRIVGMVGVTSNPTSGMTIASLIGTSCVFLLMGWTDATGQATALAVGCVVAIAASIAGDTSQDLKTGYILGATPRIQQVGEFVGVLTAAWFVGATVWFLDQSYGLGSDVVPAPQGTLMKLVIEGVLQSKLPWALIAIGAGIAIVVELLRIPSLPFAVGVYLPVTTMVPVFLGGLLRGLITRTSSDAKTQQSRNERGVLLGSGLVGGEGLLGVGISIAVFLKKFKDGPQADATLPLEIGSNWASDGITSVAAIIVFAMLALIMHRRCLQRD